MGDLLVGIALIILVLGIYAFWIRKIMRWVSVLVAIKRIKKAEKNQE